MTISLIVYVTAWDRDSQIIYRVNCITESGEMAKQLALEHIDYCYSKYGINIKIESDIVERLGFVPVPSSCSGSTILCPRKLSDAEFDAFKQLTPSRPQRHAHAAYGPTELSIGQPKADVLRCGRCPTPYCSDVESDDEETF
jgi:hypothetical protein